MNTKTTPIKKQAATRKTSQKSIVKKKTTTSRRRTATSSTNVRHKRQPLKHKRILGLRLHHFSALTLFLIGTSLGLSFLFTQLSHRADAAGCSVSTILVNSCHPWVSVWANNYPQTGSDSKSQVLYYEQRVGKKADFIHSYHPAGSNKLNTSEQYFVARANTHLLVNWKPSNSWASAGGSNGSVNAGIDQMANSIKSLGSHKIILTVFHEPENDVTSGASGCSASVYKGSSGTPADYRAMWQNVRNRFNALGVTNVVWAMNYMGFSNWDCMIDDLWPGNNLVDWVLWDPYGSKNTGWNSAVGRFYNFLNTNSTAQHNFSSKPWGLGEYGIYGATDTQEDAFYSDSKKSIDTNAFPNLKLYSLFDSIGSLGDHRINYNAAGAFDANHASKYVGFTQNPRLTDAFYSTGSIPNPTPTPPSPPPSADVTRPSVKLTSPANGVNLSGTTSITGTASDKSGINLVSFIVDGAWVASDTTSPYGIRYDTKKLANGTHTMRLRAWDKAGNYADTATIKVNIKNTKKPTIGSSASGSSANKPTVISATTIKNLSSSQTIPLEGIIKITPTVGGEPVTVKVDGKQVKNGVINSENLTDGKHSVDITENGKTKQLTVSVDNPWNKEIVNEVAAHPAQYGGGGSAVLGFAGWLLRNRFWLLFGR